MNKFTIVHAYSDDVQIKKEASQYAAKGYCYLVPSQENIIQMARTVNQADKDRSEWIRKYENVLRGLRYWQNRAHEAETIAEGR